MVTQIKFFGVRGSITLAHKDFINYGGNTASLTLRTPENTLIFLDAGSGLHFAQNELKKKAERVFLLLSHTHVDHIIGLGMSEIVRLTNQVGYESKKLKIIGPKNVTKGLTKFYDGERIWPVSYSKDDSTGPNLPDIDYENIIEFDNDFQKIEIDKKTKLILFQGNHPIKDGVIFFRIEITVDSKITSIIYATDNEFDFNHNIKSEFHKYELKYLKFIENCDLLIADAQYTKEDYELHKGFGHSYPEKVLQLAIKANVRNIILTHHHLYNDNEMDIRIKKIQDYLKENNLDLKVAFAKENSELWL
ncbi:MAG: Ribonuclease BN [Candidatus Heimdallarchaeota archaeon LC_3]|nr:MAG: Ribonuclease BN [Candidatus Heimdallarchaeota archaeon LC_3]